MKTQLPEAVRFIKYHWRHCEVFNPADNNKQLFEHAEGFAHRHAFPNDATSEEKCKAWLKENGYSFTGEGDKHKTGEVWRKA